MKHLFGLIILTAASTICTAGTHTWDGKYDTDTIEVTVVYFVPSDRQPLIDWRDRVDYYCRRIEQFHAREFQRQSTLRTLVHPEPLISELTTGELRGGDADAIYYRTLEETDRRLKFAQAREGTAFPILLVLSEINWRPLDDFYRLRPDHDRLVFEGINNHGQHFPGARSGGARASYRPRRGVGWGLVSADGWRVPYRGSDCVIYHEGCGHTVGLPHPQPGNGSVMGLAQYLGWISESWLDKDQKSRLGWEPGDIGDDSQTELFSKFRALPAPAEPRPGEQASLTLDWPSEAKVKSFRVRYQTSIDGPWIEAPQQWDGDAPQSARLGTFDRPTPISYRVDVMLEDGANAELWGYFQVRSQASQPPKPLSPSADLLGSPEVSASTTVIQSWPESVDLLELADPENCWVVGKWSREDDKLLSPKRYGARLELPFSPPAEYRLTLMVEPLDDPNGLILGQRMGSQRFVTLFNHVAGDAHQSAVENVDGRNVGNETTFKGAMFQQNRLSQVIVTVRKDRVLMSVDGHTIAHWKGTADRLSLSDYWKTPSDAALFLGAYDCRYRFHRITLEPLSGEGKARTP